MGPRFFLFPRPLPTHLHADASQDAVFGSIFISADALAPTPSTAPLSLPLSSMDDRRTRKASRGTCTRRASLRSTPVPPPPTPTLTPHIGGSGACAAEESDPESFPGIPADASNQLPRSLLSVGKVLPIKTGRRKAFRVGRRRRWSAWTKRVQTRLRSAREARPRRARWRSACGKVLGRTPDAEGKPTGDGSLLADRTVRRTSCTEDVDARVRTW